MANDAAADREMSVPLRCSTHAMNAASYIDGQPTGGPAPKEVFRPQTTLEEQNAVAEFPHVAATTGAADSLAKGQRLESREQETEDPRAVNGCEPTSNCSLHSTCSDNQVNQGSTMVAMGRGLSTVRPPRITIIKVQNLEDLGQPAAPKRSLRRHNIWGEFTQKSLGSPITEENAAAAEFPTASVAAEAAPSPVLAAGAARSTSAKSISVVSAAAPTASPAPAAGTGAAGACAAAPLLELLARETAKHMPSQDCEPNSGDRSLRLVHRDRWVSQGYLGACGRGCTWARPLRIAITKVQKLEDLGQPAAPKRVVQRPKVWGKCNLTPTGSPIAKQSPTTVKQLIFG